MDKWLWAALGLHWRSFLFRGWWLIQRIALLKMLRVSAYERSVIERLSVSPRCPSIHTHMNSQHLWSSAVAQDVKKSERLSQLKILVWIEKGPMGLHSLLAGGGYWGTENHFKLGEGSLVDCLYPSRQRHTDGPIWSDLIRLSDWWRGEGERGRGMKMENGKLGENCIEGKWGAGGVTGVYMIKIDCVPYKIVK